MTYAVHLDGFEGSMSVLLQLIEDKKVEITNISLVAVTDSFIAYLREQDDKLSLEELADFLIVASKLLYLKSRTLIPWLQEPDLEEGHDLEAQLRLYQVYAQAAKQLGGYILDGRQSFGREKQAIKVHGIFVLPNNLTAEMFSSFYLSLLRRLEPLLRIPLVAAERVVSLEERMEALCKWIVIASRSSLHSFLAETRDREEMVVTFLALLELLKQKVFSVKQRALFHDIQIEKISV